MRRINRRPRKTKESRSDFDAISQLADKCIEERRVRPWIVKRLPTHRSTQEKNQKKTRALTFLLRRPMQRNFGLELFYREL